MDGPPVQARHSPGLSLQDPQSMSPHEKGREGLCCPLVPHPCKCPLVPKGNHTLLSIGDSAIRNIGVEKVLDLGG